MANKDSKKHEKNKQKKHKLESGKGGKKDKSKKKKKKHDKKLKAYKKIVRVAATKCGFGVFAKQDYPAGAIVGEITGEIIVDANYGSDYCLHLGGARHLEPAEPFRFLNHCCEPNCEFDWIAGPGDLPGDDQHRVRVYLSTDRVIKKGEQLTIDYNWPAEAAIPCLCGAKTCRGWVVCPEELHLVAGKRAS